MIEVIGVDVIGKLGFGSRDGACVGVHPCEEGQCFRKGLGKRA